MNKDWHAEVVPDTKQNSFEQSCDLPTSALALPDGGVEGVQAVVAL